jgi:predicted ArsR family transcriptional regulator
MPSSKLMTYVDIAKSLRENGPQSFDQLSSLLRTSAVSLKKYLVFLAKEGMVDKKASLTGDSYQIAAVGIKILEFFKV